MFNWTYFLIYTALGYFLGGTSHISTNPHRATEWPMFMITLAPLAGLLLLAATGLVIYNLATFGAFWGVVTIGELMLGAILAGIHLCK